MERLQSRSFPFLLKAYLMLTKPGIIMGNVITAAVGFSLAAKGQFDFWLFLAMIEGLSLIIASACVFNNYIDREADKKMVRTCNRPFAKGLISPVIGLIYATLLGLFGAFILAKFTTLLTLSMALTGFFVYVIFYSFFKYYSIHGTLIGSIAGAIPPVVGYTAITGKVDLSAWILFGTIVMWQMPHFFAIAIYRLEDYAAASIPILPIKRGVKATKIQMVIYIIGFICVASALTLLSFTNIIYLLVISLLGIIWLYLGIRGFTCQNNQRWARQMFIFSLVIVMGFSITIPFSIT